MEKISISDSLKAIQDIFQKEMDETNRMIEKVREANRNLAAANDDMKEIVRLINGRNHGTN